MHPSTKFIIYLMTLQDPRMESNERIVEILEEFYLFPSLADDDFLNTLRESLKFPSDYTPGPTKHRESIAFQEKWGVRSMHLGTKAVEEANDILSRNAIREMVERMLLGRVPFSNIAKVINKQYESNYSAEGIKEFYHYYFDVDSLGTHQWYVALKEHRGFQYNKQLHGAPDVTLWQMGEKMEVDAREALEEAMAAMVMRLRELRNAPLNRDTMQMSFWCVEGIVKTQAALAETDARLNELVEKLRQFRQLKVKVVPPSASELGKLAKGSSPAKQLEEEFNKLMKEEAGKDEN